MAAEVVLTELPATGFVRESQFVPHIIPFSHATLWRNVKAKRFPAPVKLSTNVTAWKCADIHAWINSLSGASA